MRERGRAVIDSDQYGSGPPVRADKTGDVLAIDGRGPSMTKEGTVTTAHELRIRMMKPGEIAIAADWAAAEGWNPGLADTACFATVDPDGFFIAEYGDAPAATISCVNYDERFSFLGFYIVRPDLRGRGFGLRIWNAAIAHAGARTIGLDGVVARQENYRKSGFALAYPNVRYGGRVSPSSSPPADIVALGQVPFAAVEADDATVFPAPRTAFLSCWLAAPGHVGRALVRDGRLAAWGVIRPCRTGYKIGPLNADDRAAAEAVFTALITVVGGGEIFLDAPSVNRDAVALAHDHGLAPVFETARMYTGPIRPLRLERVFGITTFELG
jgi:GNAT superfamily N-acetyltransferase